MLYVIQVLILFVIAVDCRDTLEKCPGEDEPKQSCTPAYNCNLSFTQSTTVKLCGYDTQFQQPLVCCISFDNSFVNFAQTTLVSPQDIYLTSFLNNTKLNIIMSISKTLRTIEDLQLLVNKPVLLKLRLTSTSRYKRATDIAPFTSNPLPEKESNVIPNPVALLVNTTDPPLELFTSPPIPKEVNVIPAVVPLQSPSEKPDTSSIMNLFTSAPLPARANTIEPVTEKQVTPSTKPTKPKPPPTSKKPITKGTKKPTQPIDTRPIVFEDSLPTSTIKFDRIYFPDKVSNPLQNELDSKLNPLSIVESHPTPQPALEKILPSRHTCGFHRNGKRFTDSPIANVDEFPWVALLRYADNSNNDAGFRCSGSLISDRYVVTAAHCLTMDSLCVDTVRLGEWRVSSIYDCSYYRGQTECADKVINVKVAKQILHDGFDVNSRKNDIALIRLQARVPFTDFVRPICLPIKNLRQPKLGTKFTTSGWGTTPYGFQLDIKSKISVPTIHRDYCKEYQYFKEQTCIGYLKRNDFGKMDPGGPVMALDITDRPQWYLEGVMERGYGCNLLSYPGAYTRVTYYIDWLLETILKDARE